MRRQPCNNVRRHLVVGRVSGGSGGCGSPGRIIRAAPRPSNAATSCRAERNTVPLHPATLSDHLRRRWIRGPLLFVAVAAGYLAMAQFVLWLNDPVNLGAGFWPAAGFSLGVLVLVPPKRWGWVLAGVGLAELGGDLAHGYPLDASLWWTAGNCIEPLVGALLLRWWGTCRGRSSPCVSSHGSPPPPSWPARWWGPRSARSARSSPWGPWECGRSGRSTSPATPSGSSWWPRCSSAGPNGGSSVTPPRRRRSSWRSSGRPTWPSRPWPGRWT